MHYEQEGERMPRSRQRRVHVCDNTPSRAKAARCQASLAAVDLSLIPQVNSGRVHVAHGRQRGNGSPQASTPSGNACKGCHLGGSIRQESRGHSDRVTTEVATYG